MRPPVGGRLFRRVALLHFLSCWAFPQRHDFPLLWLAREFGRLDDLVDGLRRGEVDFCRVHVCVSFLKERDCSLHRTRESNPVPNETLSRFLPLAGSGAGAMECQHNCWREIARSNQKWGKPAEEHGRTPRRVKGQPFIDNSGRKLLTHRYDYSDRQNFRQATAPRHTNQGKN
jgi:hypothetical protein